MVVKYHKKRKQKERKDENKNGPLKDILIYNYRI